jgi:uncharacterized protein YqeY
MEERIQRDIMVAMKEKNDVKLASLRAVKTAIMQTKTSPSFKGDRDSVLPDSDVLKIMQKLVKEREDAAKIYADANRPELAEKEMTEANIIKTYLPKQLSIDEVTVIVKEVIAEVGASTMKDMGKVIGLVNQRVNGQSDGKTISGVVKTLLS